MTHNTVRSAQNVEFLLSGDIQECLSRTLVSSDDNAIEVSANNEDTELYNSDDVVNSFKDIPDASG